MSAPIITTNDVRKNDKFAVAGFVLGVISIIYILLIRLFFYFYTKDPSCCHNSEIPHIAEEFIWFLIILSLAINLIAMVLAVAGIIRIKLNKERKGLWLAVTGAVLVLVPLIFIFWLLIFY